MNDASPHGSKWRVDPPAGVGHGHYRRSQPAAYRKVAELTATGETATVYVWEDSSCSWQLYEVIEAQATTNGK
jgi:hypothetical protein